MLPIITVFGIQVPSYALLAVMGMIFALMAAVKYGNLYGFLKADILFSFAYGSFGMVIGAKIFYAVPFLPEIVSIINKKGFLYIQEHAIEICMEIFAGYVFYGGLIGMVFGVGIYGYIRKLPILYLVNVLAICVPLFHGFGRIGCFLAGCCYGEIGKFPVQLVESIGNFILFFCLAYYGKEKRKAGTVFGIYLVCYTIFRFILEFFREDEIRGVFEIGRVSISFSQIISMILFAVGIHLLSLDKVSFVQYNRKTY